MKPPANQPKDQLYTSVEIVLDNAPEDTEIAARLEKLVWTDADFNRGRDLLSRAMDLEAKTSAALGIQKRATSRLSDSVAAVIAAYMYLVITCRDVLADTDAGEALGVAKPRVNYNSFGPWRQQAARFFSTALDDPVVWAAIEGVGFERADFEAVRDQVEQAADLNADQARERSTYQSLSERLKATREELRAWYGQFVRRARRALRDDPQKLETLGVTA